MLIEQQLGSGKLRKPPPVTPKRFQKFFTPRSSTSRISRQSLSKSGRQLRDITQSGLNRRAGQRTRSPRKTVVFEDTIQETPPTKRRKLYLTPDSSPPQSSPCKTSKPLSNEDISSIAIPSSPPQFLQDENIPFQYRSLSPEPRRPPPRIQRARALGVSGRILQRSFGIDGTKKDNCSRKSSMFLPSHRISALYSNLIYRTILVAYKFELARI